MSGLSRRSAAILRQTLRSINPHRCRAYRLSTLADTELPPPRLNYRDISDNVTSKSINALNRKAAIPSEAIPAVARAYTEVKRITTELNEKRNARSVVSERIRTGPDEQTKSIARIEATKLKEEIRALEATLAEAEQQCLSWALTIPNDTHPESPLGPESAANILSTHGPELLPTDSKRDHVLICQKFGLLDLESAATVTGSSFYFLTKEAALLELALTNYAMSIAINHGFEPVSTPDIVRCDIARRCGFQPRDDSSPPVSHMYHIASTKASSPELVLSGTSEIPLAGMFANKHFNSTVLPRKVVGVGHAFRSEAGARSADTRGLYRVHQFTKVELFAVTAEDASEAMMEEMRLLQQIILQGLELPFRVLDMPTEELGASAYRKYDMEVWMPGRGTWGEVSSLSNCTDFQARRLHIRYRGQSPSSNDDLRHSSSNRYSFAHTLNGTAVAIPRLIVALIENGAIFNENGELTGIRFPNALKPFWIGGSNVKNIIQWS